MPRAWMATSWQRFTNAIEFGNAERSASVLSRSLGRRGKEATRHPIMEARRAKKVPLVVSSRRSKAARKVGSWGTGTKGWMYMKKSSRSSCTVCNEHMASAEAGKEVVGEGIEATDCRGVLGKGHSDKLAGESSAWASSFCFFNFSACRFGGPLLLLGLEKVHGISSVAQDRQGGPLTSHFPSG